MDEVDERALRQAREQLTDDAHVAALLAAGDPAAERAALALAINAGTCRPAPLLAPPPPPPPPHPLRPPPSRRPLQARRSPGAARLPRVVATILREPRRETGPHPGRRSGA